MLGTLGVNADCERVYRAMLTDPKSDATRLAERLSLSVVVVRQALDCLYDLALLRLSSEQPSGLCAVSPDIGFQALLAQQQAELAAQTQRIEESRAAAARLIAEYADHWPATAASHVEHLVDIDAIRNRLAELGRTAQLEVMTLAPEGSHTPEAVAAARPLNRQLFERGVAMRTVYLDSVRNDLPTMEYLGWLNQNGAAVRTVPSLPVRMVIVDRQVVVIPSSAGHSGRGAIVLQDRVNGAGTGAVTALCALFENIWSQAAPLGEDRRRDGNGLIPQEREVLRLLAQGYTDETIARRLGVSPRTARRVASDLISKLDARSRFQAGVHAVQDGILPAAR